MNIIFTCAFFSISEEEFESYESSFPGINIPAEFRKMDLWLRINPKRRKKNYPRFISGWLARTHKDLLMVELKNSVREYRAKAESRVGTFEYAPVRMKVRA